MKHGLKEFIDLQNSSEKESVISVKEKNYECDC